VTREQKFVKALLLLSEMNIRVLFLTEALYDRGEKYEVTQHALNVYSDMATELRDLIYALREDGSRG
jgi:hypothetical protein